jgi:hypothetical protein
MAITPCFHSTTHIPLERSAITLTWIKERLVHTDLGQVRSTRTAEKICAQADMMVPSARKKSDFLTKEWNNSMLLDHVSVPVALVELSTFDILTNVLPRRTIVTLQPVILDPTIGIFPTLSLNTANVLRFFETPLNPLFVIVSVRAPDVTWIIDT